MEKLLAHGEQSIEIAGRTRKLDSQAAAIELMPCQGQSGSRSSAAPRSNHTGGVNATHIDGSGVWISNDIEQHLMARLVSINDAEGEIEGERR